MLGKGGKGGRGGEEGRGGEGVEVKLLGCGANYDSGELGLARRTESLRMLKGYFSFTDVSVFTQSR
jgi:hypothetical protein